MLLLDLVLLRIKTFLIGSEPVLISQCLIQYFLCTVGSNNTYFGFWSYLDTSVGVGHILYAHNLFNYNTFKD